MKRLFLFLFLAITIVSCASSKNTAATTEADIENMLNKQRYTFVARTVAPTEDSRYNPRLMFPNGSNLYQLSSGYDLKVTRDSVSAYLPFFGRAYTAPLDPSKGGIKFTSTNFDYKTSMRKKNTEITIIPKDVQDIRSILISVTPGGYAYVQVLSLNRTPISFNGVIEPAP